MKPIRIGSLSWAAASRAAGAMNTVAVTAANRPRRKITLTRIFRYPFPDWFLVIETSVRMRPNACQVCKLPHRRDRGGAWDGAWDGPPSRGRSEERRVGKGGVSTGKVRWGPSHSKQK